MFQEFLSLKGNKKMAYFKSSTLKKLLTYTVDDVTFHVVGATASRLQIYSPVSLMWDSGTGDEVKILQSM